MAAVEIFKELAQIKQLISIDWSSGKFGPWNGEFAVNSWSFSTQETGSPDIYDYYLIEAIGQVMFLSSAGWHLAAHGIIIEPTNSDLSSFELVGTSPDTSQSSTSYTTSNTTQINGSVGFFGDTPTFSVGGSYSVTNSNTHSVSDLIIENKSRSRADGTKLITDVLFIVAPGTPLATSNCPVDVMAVYRTKQGTGLTFQVAISVLLAGGDPSETAALPYSPTIGVSPVVSNSQDTYLNGKVILQTAQLITLTAPPAPGGSAH